MEASPKMMELIFELAKQRQVDLSQKGGFFRIHLTGGDRFVAENIGRNRIYVGYYYTVEHESIPDPEATFFTGIENKWIPLQVTKPPDGVSQYATTDDNNEHVIILDAEGQAGLAHFTEQWATELQDQGVHKETEEMLIPF